MNMNDIYRAFREKVRDDKNMLEVYRNVRELRDQLIKESADKANDFIEYFKSLPLDKQLDLLVQLYDMLFGK